MDNNGWFWAHLLIFQDVTKAVRRLWTPSSVWLLHPAARHHASLLAMHLSQPCSRAVGSFHGAAKHPGLAGLGCRLFKNHEHNRHWSTQGECDVRKAWSVGPPCQRWFLATCHWELWIRRIPTCGWTMELWGLSPNSNSGLWELQSSQHSDYRQKHHGNPYIWPLDIIHNHSKRTNRG